MDPRNKFEVVYKTMDGSTVTTNVYVPEQEALGSQHSLIGPKQLVIIIVLHGGAYMLGNLRMNSPVQINDFLSRGWLVVAPDHRLCPQVNILEGPITDTRDLLAWIYAGDLDTALAEHHWSLVKVDKSKIIAFGTSSGSTSALSLGYSLPSPAIPSSPAIPPAAIVDFCSAKNFGSSFWTTLIDGMPTPLCTPEMREEVYNTYPVLSRDGMSLEGQAEAPSAFSMAARLAFALSTIAAGRVINVNYPGYDAINAATC
ncbi:Alpha/Beta hydrolase protein [Penicillium herquei]|nr:Alpha/Beta hydrolase protein [Penicillium herquei]